MISLKEESKKLLLKCLKNHRPDLQWIIETEEFVEINMKLGNELRNAVGDELLLNGSNDDNCTLYGWELEHLIDEIGHLFML